MTSERRVNLQPAYILHSRAYRETSAILEVFTQEHGRRAVVARGVRGRKTRSQALLQPFRQLLISWQGAGTLATLCDSESRGAAHLFSGQMFISAFYINELLLRLVPGHDPHPGLYALYHDTLERLAGLQPASSSGIEPILRRFERCLLDELGYGLILDSEVRDGAPLIDGLLYHYHIDSGPVVQGMGNVRGIPVHGATLKALAADDLQDTRAMAEAKNLLRSVLAHHLGHRPLHSREMMKQAVF